MATTAVFCGNYPRPKFCLVGVTLIRDVEFPPRLPTICPPAPDPRRSLANVNSGSFESATLVFQCFDQNAIPPRSLPIVLEHCELVGPLGLEPRTKGFTRPHRFRREWTISSPPNLRRKGGAGRSCLSLSAT